MRFVAIVNLIVNEMLPAWQDKAYLLYYVFAGMHSIPSISYPLADINIAKGSMLSSVARGSETERRAFVSGIVDELKKLSISSKIEGTSLFNPTTILGSLLPNKRYGFPTI